ncbi:MBL fold metallo-hydrolase [soil metagenome]
MKITKYIHSCLLLEKDTDKILFDPGLFSFVEGKVKPNQFQDLTAIILTHCHPDHIDDESLKQIIDNNPKTVVLANTQIQSKLAEKKISVEVFENGTRQIGSFNVEALDAPHEKLLADEIPQNTAYIVDEVFLNPGDSLAESLYAKKNTRVLALPLMAPWETELQTFEFAKKMSPQQVVPIHDGYAKDFFLESRYQTFLKFLKREEIEFLWMNKPGDFTEL